MYRSINSSADSHDCVGYKSLKISDSLIFLGNVSSGCKMSCGVTSKKQNDIYYKSIHDICKYAFLHSKIYFKKKCYYFLSDGYST